MENYTRPENELIDLILKYRTDLEKGEYVDISEREKDRQRLNELYQTLQNIHQKILDSKCYLQLGKIQKEQTIKFLADDTTQSQRMEMLAYVFRTLTHPILMIHGKGAILSSHSEETVKDSVEIIEPEQNAQKEKAMVKEPPICKPASLTHQDIEEIAQKVKELVEKYQTLKKWQNKLTISHAEILSQLASKGEVSIQLSTPKKSLSGTKTSFVLKET